MQTGVVLAIALIPVYVIVLSVIVNVVLYKNRPAFRDAFISPSHRIPATIRYLLPYPFSAYGWGKSFPAAGNAIARETRQRAELRPVTLPPLTTDSGTTSTARGAGTAGSATNAQSTRVITRGGRRWGRTGSQRSTQTLPLYTEDVGDEDVVLIAKRESMRSMMSSRSRTGANQGDIAEEEEMDESSRHGEIPQGTETQSIHSHQGNEQYPSGAMQPDSRHERSHISNESLTMQDQDWGEAPMYENLLLNPIDPDSSLRTSSDTVNRSGEISRIPTGGSQTALTGHSAVRDSIGMGTTAGFRSFVNRLTGRLPAQPGRYVGVSPNLGDVENGHLASVPPSESFAMTGRPRGFSNASLATQLPVDSGGRRFSASSGTARLRGHTGIASTNNSLVSLLLHPTMSNQSTDPIPRFQLRGRCGSDATSVTPDPSSPSASVVNLGISPPIPGSVIRSAYIQPRAGFSKEQLKFLSSTETLGKYGANFGPEDAGAGLLPSSQLHTTRSRSGSASSVGAVSPPAISSNRRISNSGAVAATTNATNDGLPSFEDLIREEAVAEEQRRRSSTLTSNAESTTRSLTHAANETSSEETVLPPPTPNPNQDTVFTEPPAIRVPAVLPNFDLAVVPPTPTMEENRRSFINGHPAA
ncbi:hypothetical protein NliqN6_3597 [Naganishia liquefaciens]|uniref:Uncharacterized protein n=1 Tax=Naganishia liquefaciens TaxID=104408 RepID=A0A8H3TUZ6_9TREE|nr:hypothetical protein NliqN6_3597 [Naganishia liquefaciens]